MPYLPDLDYDDRPPGTIVTDPRELDDEALEDDERVMRDRRRQREAILGHRKEA